MAYTTSAMLQDAINELNFLLDNPIIQGNESPVSRVRSQVATIRTELVSILASNGSAPADVAFRSAYPALIIAIGYFWAAVALREGDSSDVGKFTFYNNLWSALSYLQAGQTRLVSALVSPDEPDPLYGVA